MNPKSYRILVKPVSTRVRCPVCHQEVYSRAGIHPQCAVRQSEPARPKTIKVHIDPALADPAPASTGQADADAVGDLPATEIRPAPDGIPV